MIDILRVSAVFVLVLMHWVYPRVTPVDGDLRIDNALHGPGFLALSWVLQVMLPAFFIAGGFATTVVLDRSQGRGTGYGGFLGLRARLVTAVGVLALVLMVVPGRYFPTNLGMADAPVSNLMPLTSALSVLGIVQLALLGLLSERLRDWQPSCSSGSSGWAPGGSCTASSSWPAMPPHRSWSWSPLPC